MSTKSTHEPFWKARYTVLLFIWLAWMLSYIDRQVMNFSIGLIGEEFGLDKATQGWILSSFFAGYALFQIPGGYFADKWGPRLSMAIAIAWWSIFTILTGVATSLMILLTIRFMFGIGEGAFPAGSWKSISTHFPSRERGRATAIQASVGSLGSAFSAIVGAGLIIHFGWRNVFMVLGIPGFLVALGIYYYCRNKPSECPAITEAELNVLAADEAEMAKNTPTATRTISIMKIFKDPMIWKLTLIWCLFNATFWGFTSWLPTYLMQERGLSLARTGTIAAIPFIIGALGTFVGGYFSDKYKSGRKILYAIVACAGGLFLYLTLKADALNWVIIHQSLATFFMFFGVGVFWGIVMDAINKNSMGMASGFINIGSQVAAFGILPLMGKLVDANDGKFDHAFFAIILTLVLSGVVMMFIRPSQQKA